MNIESKNNKQKITGGLLTLALSAALLAGCGSSSSGTGTAGLFDGIEWGTSYDEAKETLTETEGVEAADLIEGSRLQLTVENYLDVEGVTATINCSFDNGDETEEADTDDAEGTEAGLDEVLIYLEFDEESYTNDEIMEQYAEILTEDLGECSSETDEAKTWNLDGSEVQLAVFSYGTLIIEYSPVD